MIRTLSLILLLPITTEAQTQTGRDTMLQIDNLPRVHETYGSNAATRINASLFAMDQDILQTVAECGLYQPDDLPAPNSGPNSGPNSDPPTEHIFWDRHVQITLDGPAYLAILITD